MNYKKQLIAFKLLLNVLVFGSMIQSADAQQVSPFQTGDYIAGFMNVRDMAKMQPGLDIILYDYYVWTNSFADRDGVKYDEISLGTNTSIGLDINTFAIAPAFYWGSKFTLLGGATYVAGIAPNYYSANTNIVMNHEGLSQSGKSNLSGFGDLFVQPLGLSWGWTHFDAMLAYAFTAPTGRYEPGADDNIGMGFWANQFQGFGYWYPNESQKSAFMLGLTYELISKVKGEELKPGNRFTLEYGFSQYLTDRLEVSVIGGNNWQVTDDTGDDVFWDPSYHDRKATLGFSAAYWPIKNRLYVAGKYMFDYGARQRFLTNGLMLNVIFVTNALTGNNSKKTIPK